MSLSGSLLISTVVLACSQVYLKYGAPRLRPFPAALKQWAAPVTATHDFQYAMLSMLFLSSKPVALVQPVSAPLLVLQAAQLALSQTGCT